MELVERYIYAVTKQLPQSQREDIAIELRSLIEDMIDERGYEGTVNEKTVIEILKELGEPRKLADKYRGSKLYLIGPELFDSYVMVLKISIIATIFGIAVTFIIRTILEPFSILDAFISFIVSIFTALPMAFGWTTIAFAGIQYVGKSLFKKQDIEKGWDPSNLPPVPNPRGTIKRGDVMAGIIFYIIFLAVFGFSHEYFGVWSFEDGSFKGVIPFFKEASFGYYLFIFLIFGFGIMKECLKLVFGRWTKQLVLFIAFVNVIGIIVLLSLLNGPSIWNPDFMSQLVEMGLLATDSESYDVVSMIWEKSTTWMLIFLIISLVWDAVDGFLRLRKSQL